MSETHARGYVLLRRERGEADLYLELLLDDGRLARVVARNAARSVRRFAAGLSPLTLYRFSFGRAPIAGGLPRLDEAVVERGYPGVLADLRRMSAAAAACTLARDLAGEVAFDAGMFELLTAVFEALDAAPADRAGPLLIRFAFDAFAHAGHPVVLDACVRCGRAAPDNALVRVSPTAGGVVCAACGGAGGAVLHAAERRALRAVAAGDAGAFERGQLHWLARFVGVHAERGAEAVANAMAHF